MPVITLKLLCITGALHRARKLCQPLRHLLPFDGLHAQALDAAPQLAGVLGSDNDAGRHYHSFLRVQVRDILSQLFNITVSLFSLFHRL